MDRFMNFRVGEEKWEDPPQPTFKEVLAKPALKPVLPPRMEDIGERYGDREWEQRKQRLLSCDESQKIGFVDSHFHLDKIRAVAGFSALQSISNNGPMPQTPVRLQHAVCNFCHVWGTKSGGYGCIQTGSPLILHLRRTSKGSEVRFSKTT